MYLRAYHVKNCTCGNARDTDLWRGDGQYIPGWAACPTCHLFNGYEPDPGAMNEIIREVNELSDDLFTYLSSVPDAAFDEDRWKQGDQWIPNERRGPQ